MKFEAHDIDPKLPGAYAVNTADFNNDGKLDVIANSLGARELAWYENPTWERHVIVSDTMQIVNQAPADINGDGIPELAFQSSFAMQAAKSEGLNWIARSQGPGQPWKAEKFDAFPTSHHVVWADLDGDGKKELINAPLIGASEPRAYLRSGQGAGVLVRPGRTGSATSSPIRSPASSIACVP